MLSRSLIAMLPIIYMSLIWIQSSYFNLESLSTLSSQISLQVILFFGIILELAHLFEFGILYLLFIFVFLAFGRLTHWKEVLAVTLAITYGVIDEVHQMYVPYRSASVVDLVKNTVGIVVVYWIIHKHYFVKTQSGLARAMRRVTQTFISGNG